MNHPTQQQIEEAKAYIRSRVEAELSMKRHLGSLLQQAASRLERLAVEYGMSVRQLVGIARSSGGAAFHAHSFAIRSRVRQIIDWLMFMIEDCVDTLSVGPHQEDADLIVSFVKRQQHGRTFHERLSAYADDFVFQSDAGRSPSKALALLSTFAVTEGWMRWWGLNAERNGASGFYSFRGSSYPCSLCDSMVGFHPMSAYVGAWHPHCKCYFVFV